MPATAPIPDSAGIGLTVVQKLMIETKVTTSPREVATDLLPSGWIRLLVMNITE